MLLCTHHLISTRILFINILLLLLDHTQGVEVGLVSKCEEVGNSQAITQKLFLIYTSNCLYRCFISMDISYPSNCNLQFSIFFNQFPRVNLIESSGMSIQTIVFGPKAGQNQIYQQNDNLGCN